VFVATDFVESGDPLSFIGDAGSAPPDELAPLTWSELTELRDLGWEIGSHSAAHPLLPTLADSELRSELERSRRSIEERLGTCDTLAYPYGVADERVAAAAEGAGYLAACTLTGAHRVDERFRRSRVGIYRGDSGLRARAKFSPIGQKLRRTALAERAAARRAGREMALLERE
jgi:peptidoglycan/xylan/chitin deacetylase (PgdA/CDA1 family)